MPTKNADQQCAPANDPAEPKPAAEHVGSGRDPEERPVSSKKELREKMLDKTLADSFPTSDPPSSIPDPLAEDSLHVDPDREGSEG